MHVDMYTFSRHTHKCKVDICSGVEKNKNKKAKQTDKTKQNKNKKDKGKNK